MRIFTEKPLKQYAVSHPEAKSALQDWIKKVKESQYEWAVARVEQLLPLVNDNTPETDPNYIELVLLSNLVADYSEEHFALGNPSLIDVIKLRMYEMGLTQASLAKLIGVSPSIVCDYLSGKAEPTLKVGRAISTKLNISPSIVLGV
ncbi:MAG: helix-turn-helix domain-containing protein [Bacteroides sp.]|nr:helix-turn-helix domain-containing protein [Bacteroides sp.]